MVPPPKPFASRSAPGDDLSTIESAAEANWTFNEVLRLLQRSPRGEAERNRNLDFFVNLQKLAYNSTGWASSSGALHNSSVVPMNIANKECPSMHDYALLSWSRRWPYFIALGQHLS